MCVYMILMITLNAKLVQQIKVNLMHIVYISNMY